MKPISISKIKFLNDLVKKMRRLITRFEIMSIMNVFFEELMKDLESGREIKVHNFGSLWLKTNLPRAKYNPLKKAAVLCKSYRIYSFKIAKSIKKELLENWDIDNRPDGA